MVLGQVSKINRHDIALTLPNNLTGYIPLTSISDKVTKLLEALAVDEDSTLASECEGSSKEIDLESFFVPGQYLRAYVTSTHNDTSSRGKGKKHIELSVNPRQANFGLKRTDLVVNSMVQASVISVEDHGVIMDLGIEDAAVRGFISSKELGQNIDHSKTEEGAVILCLITGLSSSGNIVKLSADTQRAGNIKKNNFLTDAPTIDSFLPGTAIEFLVAKVTPSGIAGKVMGLLDVTADLIHSGAVASGKTIEKKHTIGSKIRGRVICTFPATNEKKLGISLLEHIITLRSPRSSDSTQDVSPTRILPISTIIKEAKVAKVEPGVGLFVDIGVKGVRGFVHISRVADGKTETLSESTGLYKVGTVHRGRVIGFNSMDGLFLVSLEAKIIDAPFLRIEDLQIGQKVQGIVEKLVVNAVGIGGVLVNLADGITGLVPEMHLADIHLQNPEKKFREGLSVTARVMSINLENRQLRLTLKKALVNSDTDVWKTYDGLAPGMQTPGTLVSILSSGAVVQFYGSVRAFLPVSEMSESYIQDPRQHFRVGQVVNVHIMSVDIAEGRMTVSCRDPSSFTAAQRKALLELTPGHFASGIVSEKTNDELVLELSGSGLKASLPVEHLADGSTQKAGSIAKSIRVGQTLEEVLVLSKQEAKRLVRLTKKSSLVKAAKSGHLLNTFDNAVEGAEVVGFVRNITAIGAFIQFGSDLTGLLPKNQMLEEAIPLPDFGMRRNQSVSARVLSINHEQQRFLLSQKTTVASLPKHSEANREVISIDRGLSNPADEISSSMDDFTIGKLTKAKIISIKETQMNVQLADNVQGRIDVSEIFDKWEDIKDRVHPLKIFSSKKILSVRILGIHDSRNHRFLPISHAGKAPVFELSAKPSTQTQAQLDVLTLDKIDVGSTWLAFVNNVAADCLWVNLSPNVRGRIRAIDVSDDVSVSTDLQKNFPVGSAIRVWVLKVDVANNRLDLSARSGSSSNPLAMKDIVKGMVLPGRVTKVTERQILVQLSDEISGPVHLIDMADDYSASTVTAYQKNQVVRVCVKDIDTAKKRITLSTRPSRVLSSLLPIEDPEIDSISQLNVNDIIRGFIKNVADNGLFVSLASNVTAFVRISDLSDLFIKDWKANFQVDQLVKGKIMDVDPALNHVLMSLKQSSMNEDYKAPLAYADIHVGQTITGKVRKVEDFGVFIVVDNSANVSGLCHRSQLSEQRVPDARKLYEEGDTVKAKVLKIELDKRRISFGLKASYFAADEDFDDDESDQDESRNTGGVPIGLNSDLDFGNGGLEGDDVDLADVTCNNGDDVELSNDAFNGEAASIETKAASSEVVEALSTEGFDWSGDLMDQDTKDAQPDTDTDTPSPKKKKRRKADIKIDRTGDLDANGPQSVADFERLLLGQPNSSYLWLRYMAFQLQLNEAGKARHIAERAIRTIGIREEAEKLNVWVALLNLENTYGSDTSVEEVFTRACQYNDSQEIHERLTSTYIQSGKNGVRSVH